jgi:Arc/MetJ-type ribon-helix-helix transcriptional regulator
VLALPRRAAERRGVEAQALVREAVERAVDVDEQQYETKLTALQAAIDEGDASGVAESSPFARVREQLNLPTSR